LSTAQTYKSPLHQMTQTTPTVLWNDSAAIDELTYALEHGAVGATCNPVIAHGILRKEIAEWRPRILAAAAEMPTATEDRIAWRMVEEMSIRAAKLLEPAFDASGGRNGRLSIQTDPRFHRNAAALVEQAVHFASLAENVIVKIPATAAGIVAMEEATYRGISINATVSFTVPQALAVGAAVERGLKRREAEGLDVSTMGPVCTIMGGRLDDWLKHAAERDKVTIDPGHFEWAGVAALKRAYAVYQERGYRTRVLSAAFRNHMQWSELIGGDVVVSPPFGWQQRFNNSDIEATPRIDEPVDPVVLDSLYSHLEDFRRAYDVDGMTDAEFDTFGATLRTLRQFLAANNELEALVRDVVVPNP